MSVKIKSKADKRLLLFTSAISALLLFTGVILLSAKGADLEYIMIADSPALSAPEIADISNTSSGVRIEWAKVDGAEKYRIFYKNFLGFPIKIADTADTNYTWTGAKSGTEYSFTVRCITADGKSYTSAYSNGEKRYTYVAPPKISSVTNTVSGVELKWGRVNGAAKYRIFYKIGAGEWVKLDDTAFTSYTWENAESGADYTFMLRAMSYDGDSYTNSYDSESKSISYIAAPKLTSVALAEKGVQITWDKVAGASKYRILYKKSSGEWMKLADTFFTSYTWTGAESDTMYTFTVCCISSSSNNYISGYDTVGRTLVCSPSLNYRASMAAEKYSSCTRYVYGKSALGNQLEAYIIDGTGKNNKILFMDFAVHGFEDEYENDGKVLVELGNSLVEYYSAHPELLGDYRLVIVPCANPDGAMYGKNDYRADKEDAFGRCTYNGIDINRDFKADGFKAVESVALRDLMDKYKPNIYLNFHGWEDSVLGDPQLVNIFRTNVGLTTDKSYRYAPELGYIIGYVHSTYNAKAAIVEFKNSESVDQADVINAINYIALSKL